MGNLISAADVFVDRDIMRFAGPKMILRRPLLAIGHLLDKRKPAPDIN